jgi:hypothetical protein
VPKFGLYHAEFRKNSFKSVPESMNHHECARAKPNTTQKRVPELKLKLIDMCSSKQYETAIQSVPRRYQPAMVGAAEQSMESSSAECATAKKSPDDPIRECAKA